MPRIIIFNFHAILPTAPCETNFKSYSIFLFLFISESARTILVGGGPCRDINYGNDSKSKNEMKKVWERRSIAKNFILFFLCLNEIEFFFREEVVKANEQKIME